MTEFAEDAMEKAYMEIAGQPIGDELKKKQKNKGGNKGGKPPAAIPPSLKQKFEAEFEDEILANGPQLHENEGVWTSFDGDSDIVDATPEQNEILKPPLIDLNNDHGAADHLDNENNSEDEGIADYKMGGYHAVHIGEIILGRYVIIQKLGWGHFSTVWLAKDFKHETYVALKIQKSAPHYLEAAYDEVEILQKVARNCQNPEWIASLKEYYKEEGRTEFTRDDCCVVQLLNSFIYKGPYGNHFCMVFEIMGVTLLEIIKRYNYKGVPMHVCRAISKQVLIGLDFLHRICGLIHTDIKPENVLVCLTPDEIKTIYDKGMLSRGKLYDERIRNYQKKYGIKISEHAISLLEGPNGKESGKSKGDVNGSNPEVQKLKAVLEETLKQKLMTLGENTTKKQRKNAKKKLKKRFKKKIENAAHQEHANGDHDEDGEDGKEHEHDDSPEKSMEEPNEKKILEVPTRKIKAHSYPKNDGGVIVQDRKLNSEQENNGEELLEEQFKELQKENNGEGHEGHQHDDNPKEKWRGPPLDEHVKVKIVDLGNACWTYHHFTPLIQTRQYRSPETILGVHYGTSADIWSFACMMFEMLTGDFLFEPRKGPNFSKNDDHLAQIIELVSKFPMSFALSGKDARRFFTRQGNLRKIQGFHFWPLKDVIIEKYKIKEEEALAFSAFTMPMLRFHPNERATAREMLLKSEWLRRPKKPAYTMTDKELDEHHKRKQTIIPEDELFPNRHEPLEPEGDFGDDEDNDYDEEQSDGGPYHHGNHMILNNKTRATLDRSFFHGGYIGYGEGISLGEIDQGTNWQFSELAGGHLNTEDNTVQGNNSMTKLQSQLSTTNATAMNEQHQTEKKDDQRGEAKKKGKKKKH